MRFRRTIIALLVWGLLVLSVGPLYLAAASPGTSAVAVLSFRSDSANRSLAAVLGNYLEMELLGSKGLVLLEREQVRSTFQKRELNLYACQDDSCAVLAGRALSADYVVLGDLAAGKAFRLTVRVISVRGEKTIYECHERFQGHDNARAAIKKIAAKIEGALNADREASSRPATGQESLARASRPVMDISLGMLLFVPFERLAELVTVGPGFTLGIMVSRMFSRGPAALENLSLGFDTGFIYSFGRLNRADSCIMAPLLASAAYSFVMFEKVYFAPRLSLGMAVISLHHESGDGFDMRDGEVRHDVDVLFRMAAVFGRPLTRNLGLEVLTAFWVLGESPRVPFFLTVHVGITCRFDVP
jgi:hypothetical protein